MENETMFERTVKPVLDVQDKPKIGQWAFLSTQHLFAMFGSTVLVPFFNWITHIISAFSIRYRNIALYPNNKS